MNRTGARGAGMAAGGLSAGDVDDPTAVARYEAELWRRTARDRETARLRRHMVAHVRRMSTLVPAALALAGVDVAAMMWGMRSDDGWSVGALAGAWGRGALLDEAVSPHDRARRHDPLRRRGSFEIPSPGGAAEITMVEVVGDLIELSVQGSRFMLTTARGRARLTFDGSLPDTAATIVPGRQLDQVVEHHLLRGRGFVIDRIDATPASTSIEFKVTQMHVSVPDFGKGGVRAEREG